MQAAALLIAAALQAPTPEAPVVVDGTPITLAEIDAQPPALPDDSLPVEQRRALAASVLIERAWLAREAERRDATGDDPRQRIAQDVLRTTRGLRGYADAYRRMVSRWRPRTACGPGLAHDAYPDLLLSQEYLLADVCGDVPRPSGEPFRCYPMALLRLCSNLNRREWFAVGDATRYVGTYNNHGAEARLRKRLRRRDPLLARRLSWDSDADFVDVRAKSRIDVVAVLRELIRKA
jgi:hypothetical protein